jgi:all-trans-retinol dehydrogenase (NAD+)
VKSVAGKKVLVTGAAMGMGRLYARRAVEEGAAAVVLWDINEPVLKETAEELRAAGGTIHEYLVDVGSREAVADAAARVRSEVGDPDVLINNAGVVRGNKYFWETDVAADAEFTMKINSLALMYLTREFLPAMIEGGQESRIINMASAAGFVANPRMAAYAASKWAAVGFSDSVRVELEQAGHDHVKVTTVCPYYIKTGMFDGASGNPFLPLLEPEDVVAKAWKAMKKGTPFVVMPKFVVLNETMKGVFPTHLRDFLGGKVFGVHNSMKDFKGRG